MLKKYNSKLLQHSIDNFSKNKIDTCLKRNLSKSTEWLRILQANVESSHNEPFPRETKVVVCGGGVMGAAVAYHLAELGWGKHTIVVEQGRAGCATTWQSSGLVGIFKPTRAQVKLCQSSVKLYQKLDAEGFSSGWKQCGSLCVARTLDRMTVFRRMKAQSVALRVDCELVSPEEAKRLCPLLNVDDLKGGLWIPGDGVGDPYRICLSLLEAAKKKGVRVYEYCGVQQVVQEGGRVRGVETSLGSVQCEAFVNCGGFWARSIGKLSEPFVKVPLHAVEHYYLHTKKIPGLDPMTPDCSINDTESDPEPMDEDETYFDLSYAPSPDMFDNEYDNNSEAEHDRALSSLDKNKELDNIALPSIADDGNEVGGDEVESNGVGGEEVEADEVEGRKKKGRKRRYGGQDRDERKKCKYSQKDYFNYKKKKVPAKVFIDVNCGCSMECQQNNPLEVRRSEYENFVELGSYESQNLFITSKITQVYKKNALILRRVNDISQESTN